MALDRNSPCPIGKHAGKTMQYLLDNEANYLVWALENMTKGDVFYFCKQHETEIRGLAKEQKENGPKRGGQGFKQESSKPVSFSTPEVTNIYFKMFKTAFALLNPGAQVAVKDFWKDQGVEITGVREDDVQVKINK